MDSTKETDRDRGASDVGDAEQEVARTKRQFHESLQLASETGSRLAADVRKKITPTVLIVTAGVVVVAGVALVATRSERRGGRASSQTSAGGELVRAAAGWALRAVALRVAVSLAARFRDAQTLRQPVAPT